MYLNDDGKTVTTIPIQVKNGKVYFPSDFAGKGILILRDKNWDQYLYNLRNGGVRIPLSRVQYSGSQSWIADLLVFNDPTYIDYQVWSQDGRGNNPTFEINVTVEKGIMVKTRAWTREGAEAIGFYVRPEGASEWKYYPRAVPERFTPIPLPGARTWFVIPAWNPDEFKEWDPYVGEKGDGGGIGVPVGKGVVESAK